MATLAEGRKAVACGHPLDPKSTQSLPKVGYEPSEEAFKFRRGQYFWHTRAAIGHATALAVACRARVAGHALRRNRPRLHTQDDLLYPPTASVAL